MPSVTENKPGMKVLISGSVLQLFFGIIYVWSVFVMPVSETYEWEVGGVKLMTSFMLCFFVAGILGGGKMLIKIGAEKTVLAGGLMLAAGMLATGFLPLAAARLMYVTYGVIGGFGVGAVYSAVITAVQKSFPQNRGFATGVAVCAFGFSTVIFAPLVETLIVQFTVRNTFLILAAGFAVVVLSLYRFIRLPDASAQTGAAALLEKRQYTTAETIRTKEFYLITCSMMLATAAFFILNPSIKTLAAGRGLEASAGTIIVMMTGIANAFGRLGAPMLSDKIGREKAAMTIILTTAAGSLLLCFAEGFWFMAAIAAIAFCFGGFSGVYPVLTADYFGIKNVGSNYGAVMVGFALSALAFPILFATVGSDTVKFVILSVFAVVGAVMMGVLAVLKTSAKKNVE